MRKARCSINIQNDQREDCEVSLSISPRNPVFTLFNESSRSVSLPPGSAHTWTRNQTAVLFLFLFLHFQQRRITWQLTSLFPPSQSLSQCVDRPPQSRKGMEASWNIFTILNDIPFSFLSQAPPI